MSNPTVILNGDQIYCDELIRENARLTVQHEADVARLEACEARLSEAVNDGAPVRRWRPVDGPRSVPGWRRPCWPRPSRTCTLSWQGGDPCKVCAKVCMMGEGNCQPVWTGEKTED